MTTKTQHIIVDPVLWNAERQKRLRRIIDALIVLKEQGEPCQLHIDAHWLAHRTHLLFPAFLALEENEGAKTGHHFASIKRTVNKGLKHGVLVLQDNSKALADFNAWALMDVVPEESNHTRVAKIIAQRIAERIETIPCANSQEALAALYQVTAKRNKPEKPHSLHSSDQDWRDHYEQLLRGFETLRDAAGKQGVAHDEDVSEVLKFTEQLVKSQAPSERPQKIQDSSSANFKASNHNVLLAQMEKFASARHVANDTSIPTTYAITPALIQYVMDNNNKLLTRLFSEDEYAEISALMGEPLLEQSQAAHLEMAKKLPEPIVFGARDSVIFASHSDLIAKEHECRSFVDLETLETYLKDHLLKLQPTAANQQGADKIAAMLHALGSPISESHISKKFSESAYKKPKPSQETLITRQKALESALTALGDDASFNGLRSELKSRLKLLDKKIDPQAEAEPEIMPQEAQPELPKNGKPPRNERTWIDEIRARPPIIPPSEFAEPYVFSTPRMMKNARLDQNGKANAAFDSIISHGKLAKISTIEDKHHITYTCLIVPDEKLGLESHKAALQRLYESTRKSVPPLDKVRYIRCSGPKCIIINEDMANFLSHHLKPSAWLNKGRTMYIHQVDQAISHSTASGALGA